MRQTIFLLLFSFMASFTVLAQDKMSVYQNYDFVPGDKIIFEDDLSTAVNGEFPPMWKLISGQGVVNKQGDQNTFVLTDGSYAVVAPRIKTATYLDSSFTVECEYYSDNGDLISGIIVFMPSGSEDELRGIQFDNFGNTSTLYFPEGVSLEGKHPDAEKSETGKWRHVAIAYKNGQMKCYVDQYRVLVIPHTEYQPKYVRIGGTAPVRFRNVRIALGGGMNKLDQLYKDGRIVTHGIVFDVNKATIKPQSMGVINEVAGMLKRDTKITLSIEGHTDSDGDDKSNQILSEQRAESVKKALVGQGVDAARLRTKGLGESKPIADNSTPEGKANNRRVEFVLVK